MSVPATELPEVLTTAEVAELLRLRPSTVDDYARRGVIPSLVIGRHRRFIRADVLDVLRQLRDDCASGSA